MVKLTIGQLAKSVNVNVETVRYYERRGLIPKPPRLESGYRQYSQNDIARIQFIKRAKELGFTLKEITELLSLRIAPDTTCSDVKAKAEEKIKTVDEKIRTLQSMKKALLKLTHECSGAGPISECPILDAMQENTPKGGENT